MRPGGPEACSPGRQAGVDGPKSLQARPAVSQHVPLLTALWACTLVDIFPGLTAGRYMLLALRAVSLHNVAVMYVAISLSQATGSDAPVFSSTNSAFVQVGNTCDIGAIEFKPGKN